MCVHPAVSARRWIAPAVTSIRHTQPLSRDSPPGTSAATRARFLQLEGDVIHFTLLDRFGDDYNAFRGPVLEVYATQMVRTMLSVPAIPERPYRKRKQELRGPDLTIVDELSKTLLVIEIKARRTIAETRISMDEAQFDANFSDAHAAILKLRTKIEDLYAGRPEYADAQNAIGDARARDPICICVIAEGPYSVSELVRYRAEHEPNHPLHGFPYPFCLVTLDAFEDAMAIAATRGRAIGDVMREYWEDTADLELHSRSADQFRGTVPERGSRFAEKFV